MGKFFDPSPRQIEAFVAKYFEYKERKSGSELVICNPFDGDDGWHFNISKIKGVCHCWHGDDWAGPPSPRTNKRNTSFIKFVQKFLDCTYRDAVKAICDVSSDRLPSFHREDRKEQVEVPVEGPLVKLPAGSEPISTSTQTLAAAIVGNWLESRGITEEDVQKHDIHHLATSVIWPYYEFEILVYWQMRNRLNKQFLFPDEREFGVSKGQFLYNFDQVEPASDIVIVESIFNCFTIRDQCVATGGADITPQQAQKIHLLGPRDGIILAPDNDLPGIKSVIKNGKMLRERGFQVYYSLPPQIEYTERTDDGPVKKLTNDWNELGQYVTGFKEVNNILNKNIRLLDMPEVVRLQMYVKRTEMKKKLAKPQI